MAQEGVNVKLQIRDDGSTDDTIKILESYNDPRISIRTGGNLKPALSFLTLLRECEDSEYYAYCDQDDYWYPNKLITAIKDLQSIYDPALFISTYDVCDEKLNKLFTFDMKFEEQLRLQDTLLYRAPSACNMVFNHKLREAINRSNPKFVRMHDFWTLIVALSHQYKIITKNVPLIKYRQHEGESVGITPSAITRVKRLIRSSSKGNNERWRQAKEAYAFENGYSWIMTLDQDSVCPDGFVDRLSKHCNEGIAIVGPRIIYEGNEQYSAKYEKEIEDVGKDNIDKLITSLEQYAAKGFDTSTFFYETALSCLREYVQKNKDHGHEDPQLEQRIGKLPGKANDFGGSIIVSAPSHPENLTYEQLVKTRHSIRHFSDKPVDVELLKDSIKLAQYTPSACNRQGWKTRIVADKEKIKDILANQNGNRGFGQEFDKLLVVTADLRTQQKSRELFQAFIDGGMYAESVLNCLYSKGIGSVPLSASLTAEQDKNVRAIVGMDDAEVFILFIGVGNYPDGEFLTTRSERKPIEVEVI